MDRRTLSKSPKSSKIMPKIKTILGEEPLEWPKHIIERPKTRENSEKTEYRRRK